MRIKKIIACLFGCTRSERNGSLLLVIIISLLIIVVLMNYNDVVSETAGSAVPSPEEEIDSSFSKTDTCSVKQHIVSSEPDYFDPNTAGREQLLGLGLSHSQASTLINYRNSGGYFYKPDDFRKVYGISRELQDRLVPYVVIKKNESEDAIKKTGVESSVSKEKKGTGSEEYLYVKVEINSSDSVEFMSVPGIGRVLGSRIVRYRALLGGFTTLSQLSDVYGIDSSYAAELIPYLMIDTSSVKKLDINNASYRELIRHPYISGEMCGRIMNYRKISGRFSFPGQLVVNKIMSESEYYRLKPYIFLGDSTDNDK